MFQNILVLSPHTDDGELGCGGTISRFSEEGKNVFLIAFTEMGDERLEREMREATRTLGIPTMRTWCYSFPHRRFPLARQRILEVMLSFLPKPDLVFAPSLDDIHQDHQVIAQECLRAFKRTTILGYEEPWNNLHFSTTCFIPLHRHHIDNKIIAVQCYESQKHRNYTTPDAILSLAVARGTQIQKPYAEAFEVVRLIV